MHINMDGNILSKLTKQANFERDISPENNSQGVIPPYNDISFRVRVNMMYAHSHKYHVRRLEAE